MGAYGVGRTANRDECGLRVAPAAVTLPTCTWERGRLGQSAEQVGGMWAVRFGGTVLHSQFEQYDEASAYLHTPIGRSYPPPKFQSLSAASGRLLLAGGNPFESCNNKHGEAAGVQCLRGGEGLTFIAARCQKLCPSILKMHGRVNS